jgi:hypothetical protein
VEDTVGAACIGEASIRKTDGIHSLLKWLISIVVQYLYQRQLHLQRRTYKKKSLTKRSRHEGRCKEALNLQRDEQGN